MFKDVVHMHVFVSHLSASRLVHHVAAHQVMSQFRSFLASSANAFKWHEPHISLDCQKNLATTWEFLICECWESGMFPIERRALHLLRSIPHYLRSHFQHGAGFLKIYFMSHVTQTRSIWSIYILTPRTRLSCCSCCYCCYCCCVTEKSNS